MPEIKLEDVVKRMDEQSEATELIARHMVTLAERVMKHDEGMGGYPPMPGQMPGEMEDPNAQMNMAGGGEMYPMDGGHGEMPMMPPMDPAMAGGAPPMAPPMEQPPMAPPMDPNGGGGGGYDENAYGRKGYSMSKVNQEIAKFLQEKGFTGKYETAATEEDGKWDEKDSNINGLEAQPAGQQGGEREDETFGPGGMAYKKSLDNMEQRMKALEQGITIAKAEVPGQPGGQVDKALIGQAPGSDLSREEQMQVVKSTWHELGRLAETNGYFQGLKLG